MRKAILMVVAILGFSWPAAAQNEFALTSTTPAALPKTMMVWDAPQISAGRRATERATPKFEARPVASKMPRRELTASTRVFEGRASGIMSMYEYTETPFVQHIHIPVISLAGGRVLLGGYLQMTSPENFQMGLPGAGALPAWSVGTQNHDAVIVPRADASAGFNVSLHFRGRGSRDSGLHPAAAISRAIAFVRGI